MCICELKGQHTFIFYYQTERKQELRVKKAAFQMERFPWKTSAIFLKLKSKAFTEH